MYFDYIYIIIYVYHKVDDTTKFLSNRCVLLIIFSSTYVVMFFKYITNFSVLLDIISVQFNKYKQISTLLMITGQLIKTRFYGF